MQQGASFWADIKHLEERLAQDPKSYLFARLADVYLKVNLIDDALHTARQGVARYPSYIAGQRALALACRAKGLTGECRAALETVTAALPEDVEAQTALAELLVENGDRSSAQDIYVTLTAFYPERPEFDEKLKELERTDADAGAIVGEQLLPEEPKELSEPLLAEPCLEDDDIIELTEGDIWFGEAEEDVAQETKSEDVSPAVSVPDPLSTVTLAELYVKQGFTAKALEIYRSIQADNPEDMVVASRISELEVESTPEADHAETVTAPQAAFVSPEPASMPADVPVHGRADDAIATLEEWLDTIRRIKACR